MTLPDSLETWQSGDRESSIDLILASEELTSMVKCAISDHRAIETTFDIATPERVVEGRLLFKNAPWKDIRASIDSSLRSAPFGGSVQQQTDRLMTAALEAVHALTPKAKPSPYATRWWTTDSTQLRHKLPLNNTTRESASREDSLRRLFSQNRWIYHD
jgi:hypothetical protein